MPDDIALRVRALESVLVDKGMVDPADIDEVVDAYENRIGPRNGASVVARAWVDPEQGIIGLVFTQTPSGPNPWRRFQAMVNLAVEPERSR